MRQYVEVVNDSLGVSFFRAPCGDVVNADYTEIGGDEELPLGEEFQEHLRRFLRPSEKKMQKRLELVKKLVTQMSYVYNCDLLGFDVEKRYKWHELLQQAVRDQ